MGRLAEVYPLSPKKCSGFEIQYSTLFGSKAINTLDTINALSNERQQLWLVAGKDKFSDKWYQQQERIKAINKLLERSWATHRTEVAANQVWEKLPTDRIHLAIFDDFHTRGGGSGWRIEDETAYGSHWMSVEEGLRDNQYGHYLKKPTKKRFVAPKQHPDLRKKLQSA